MNDHETISPSGFFALRTPLLPFDELLEWSQLRALTHSGSPSEEAIVADRASLRDGLRKIYARSEVREALFVASPDLEERIDLWLQQPETEQGQKIERALVRYFARMTGRATPFGLFAGCSVGTLGDETQVILGDRAGYRRHTRLDMDYLVLLTDSLAREPSVRSNLAFGVNSSLHPTRGRLRYFEVRRDGKGWTHHQLALEASDYLEATLARARQGASPGALAAALLEHDPDAPLEEAEEYIGELINSQVLVSELRPTVTGPEPIPGLATRLRERAAVPASEVLEAAQQEIESIDAAALGIDSARYRRIAELLKQLPGEVELGRLFQVDMVKPTVKASLGTAVLAEIREGVTLLRRLARRPRDDRLARFREAFVDRYEQREVPLVEALDEDTGVGFDTLSGEATDVSSLLDGLTFPKAAEESVPWGRREALLLRKLSEALATGAEKIILEQRDLEEMAHPNQLPLPDAFAVMATVAATSEAALANGDFQVLLGGASGPSGARLLGRFCHADPQLNDFVQQHVRAEEALDTEAIFAEIVHLPEGRLGNILARPILRAYEIPYLGTASVSAERQIPVTDLRVSVVGARIVLRSARLGRRVVPRLTSAHNFHASQGIYRFLCALQSQGTASDLGWDWGALRGAPFLPRVVWGRLVLSRATWQLSRGEAKPFGEVSGAARFHAVQRLRADRRLPRWIALVDADNELPIDLDNVLAVDTFVELVKGREQATLVELFPGPDQLWARGPEGRFVHELVIPFVRKDEGGRAKDEKLVDASSSSFILHPSSFHLSEPRTFPPGSEWLYIKLYTGPATLDLLLRDLIQPLVDAALRSGAADRWFFIRYGDPRWHLRLRFHGVPARLQREVLPALQEATAPLLADGRLSRVQHDTYEREVERYGGPEGTVLAERLFQADSEAVLALAHLFAEDTRGDLRWRLAIVGMDLLLSDLSFDLATRRAVMNKTRDTFATEFHTDTNFKHQLGSKFRKERKNLEALFGATSGTDARLAAGLEVLQRRSERLAPVMAELQTCARTGRLSVPLVDLAPSYLHMHVNRLLRSAHRAQELVLYDFLARLYESQAARARGVMNTGKKSSPLNLS
jgi:thiopeptide-type bacteriocin biosynthesis protein